MYAIHHVKNYARFVHPIPVKYVHFMSAVRGHSPNQNWNMLGDTRKGCKNHTLKAMKKLWNTTHIPTHTAEQKVDFSNPAAVVAVAAAGVTKVDKKAYVLTPFTLIRFNSRSLPSTHGGQFLEETTHLKKIMGIAWHEFFGTQGVLLSPTTFDLCHFNACRIYPKYLNRFPPKVPWNNLQRHFRIRFGTRFGPFSGPDLKAGIRFLWTIGILARFALIAYPIVVCCGVIISSKVVFSLQYKNVRPVMGCVMAMRFDDGCSMDIGEYRVVVLKNLATGPIDHFLA